MIPNRKTTRVFQENWKLIPTSRITINRGGSRSSKTFSLCQIAWIWLLTGNFCGRIVERGTWSIVRKTMPALKATALRDFQDILDITGTYSMVEHRKIDQIFKVGSRMIEFFPVDDAFKVRGRKRTFLWMNEANELDFENDFTQLALRTTDNIMLDFNPSQWDSWVKTEIEEKRDDAVLIHSTYKDNPFLHQAIMDEIEHLKVVDNDLYRVFCLGEYAKIVGQIYPNWVQVEAPPVQYDDLFYGLDFGYENDPTAMVEIYRVGDEYYVKEILYERGLTNQDIYGKIIPYGKVYADSAEPKSIEELRRLGWRIKAARKGKDSVVNGIQFLKSKRIYVTADSQNIITEQQRYKWQLHDGKPINKPIDAYNHGMDAIRYGITMSVRNRINIIGVK